MLLIFINVNQFYLLLPEDYRGGVFVVFMIGLSKFYDVLLGNNNSIIINTKYYRMVLVFGLATVLLMIILNWIFIPIYGINGSAFATLLTIFAYNTTKLLFVVRKMHLYPFTSKTIISFVVLIIGFLVFYFWDFPFHPIVNIALKSILFTVFYGLSVIKLAISKEINEMVFKFLGRK
jgi:O-antigen/teichoic acid export membrane protein